MKFPGLILAGVYLLACVALISTQGLFGESFIVILLGLPWSMVFSYFEFWNATGVMLYLLVFAPLGLNAWILYKIGSFFGRK